MLLYHGYNDITQFLTGRVNLELLDRDNFQALSNVIASDFVDAVKL